jgi:hypothetical protein
MCRNKMKINHTHDFSSFYSNTFPLILVFYAAFFEEYNSAFFILTVLLQQIFGYCSFLPFYYTHFINSSEDDILTFFLGSLKSLCTKGFLLYMTLPTAWKYSGAKSITHFLVCTFSAKYLGTHA